MVSAMAPFLSENQAVNHDFVNSLASVRSLSELLVDYPGLADVDRIRFLEIIREETERLMRLLVRLKPTPDVTGS